MQSILQVYLNCSFTTKQCANNVQTGRSKKLHHCKSQASVNNGSYNQGSYYRNAKSAAALVNPLTVRAVEVLHVQLHF